MKEAELKAQEAQRIQKGREEQEADKARQQKIEQAELQKKRDSLAKGFKSVASGSGGGGEGGGGTGAASSLSSSSSAAVADAAEIARVLSAPNDYACLKVHVGSGLAQIKSSYRRLAMTLHPDKCKEEGAAAAFQRINAAHANLSKALGGGGGGGG